MTEDEVTLDDKFEDKLERYYQKGNRLTGGLLGIIRETFSRFGRLKATQGAASLAYYTFFSLFPLLLVLVSVSGYFITSERAKQQVIDFIGEALPVSRAIIQDNIDEVTELRGPLGLLGLIGALWSASAAFSTLAYHVNRAWLESERMGFLRQRLIALVMIGALFVLLLLSLASTTILNLLPRMNVSLFGGESVYDTIVWDVLSGIVPLLFSFILFLALYRWVPTTEVGWDAAVWGAVVAAVGWEVAKRAFAWYLGSGLSNYHVVYGSLSTIVILLFWIYISGLITLFGAHLCATLARHPKLAKGEVKR